MHLARQDAGVELVSIDSMQIYRGMDIGTAKPTPTEQAEVPHHLLDIVDPSAEFTLSEFQLRARAAIADIESRGRTPVLVGGTGLHLRAVVDDLEIPGRYPDTAAEFENQPTDDLHRRLTAVDAEAAARMEPGNRRRIVRALEVTLGSGRPFSSYGPGLGVYGDTRFVMVGPRWPRVRINERIEHRYTAQIDAGFLDEVRSLAGRPGGLSRTAGQALGYRQLLDHLNGATPLEDAVDLAVVRTRKFARRQERWFRRDPRIRWIDVSANPLEAESFLVGQYELCI